MIKKKKILLSTATGALRKNARIYSSPFKVESCDQVIEISADTLLDKNDFSKKEKKFYTISAYLINQFDTKDTSSLSESIEIDDIDNAPFIIEGSVSCVLFFSSRRDINICLPNRKEAEEILKAFNDLWNCTKKKKKGKINNPTDIIDLNCIFFIILNIRFIK